MFLYVLKSKNFLKSYVGISEDPLRRLEEHNSGKSNYTNKYKPWKLIYTEKFPDKESAREREIYFKTAAGRRKLRKIFDKID
jgi:putative endonuclease